MVWACPVMRPSPRPARTLHIASPRYPRDLHRAPALGVPWLQTPSQKSTADVSESKCTYSPCTWSFKQGRPLVGISGIGSSEKCTMRLQKIFFPPQNIRALTMRSGVVFFKGGSVQYRIVEYGTDVWHIVPCQQKCMPVATDIALSVCVLCCRPIVLAHPSLTGRASKATKRSSVAELLLSARTTVTLAPQTTLRWTFVRLFPP